MRRPSSQCVRAPPPSRDTFVQGVYAACFCGMSWILQPPQFPRRKGEPCGKQPWASLNQDNVLTRAHCAAHVHVLPSCQPSKDPWAFPADAAGGAANGSLASPPESPVPPSLSGSFVQLALWLVSAATVKGGVPHWPGKQKILPPSPPPELRVSSGQFFWVSSAWCKSPVWPQMTGVRSQRDRQPPPPGGSVLGWCHGQVTAWEGEWPHGVT